MHVALIDYGAGNLRSAAKALERAGRESGWPGKVLVTHDPGAVRAAERVALPGVGAFADCMAGVNAAPGLRDALEARVTGDRAPFLGICVGMQLMAEEGIEFGRHAGLGWIKGRVVRLAPKDSSLKIPHTGWNTLDLQQADHPLVDGLGERPFVYFVHSYHLEADNPGDILATADYGQKITAAVVCGNLAGTQFHPEKSQAAGLKLLANFLRWQP